MVKNGYQTEIFRLAISKSQLESVSSVERSLLLLSSYAINQINVLRRLLIFSTNFESKVEVENVLSGAQTQMILRFLVGSMAETWEMIRRSDNQLLIGKSLSAEIEREGHEAHQRLKDFFGKNNVVHRLRNSVAYHYPTTAELDAAFHEVPDDEDWAWYVSPSLTNSHYYLSDLVVSSHILEVMDERDPENAFKRFMGQLIPATDDLLDFLAYVLKALVARHFGAQMLSPRPGTGIVVTGIPNMDDVAIPFLTHWTSSGSAPLGH